MQRFYTVRAGDTLASIAARWLIPLRSLAEANGGTDLTILMPGQQLSMPPGVTAYTVRPGDTADAVSRQYGIPVSEILKASGLTSLDTAPGTVLTVPAGVPFYTVRPGDTLYEIAGRYNVMTGGIPRPDLIFAANPRLAGTVYPGMAIAVPYAPAGGTGWLAAVSENGIRLYDPVTGEIRMLPVPETGRMSTVYWSPSLEKIAYGGNSGTLYLVFPDSGEIRKIDKIPPPVFADWSLDSDKLIYSNGNEIKIYTVSDKSRRTIVRPGASDVQWFPDDRIILFEAGDTAGVSQLYIGSADGGGETQITGNSGTPYHWVRLSPDGRYVLYTWPGESVSEIYVLDLAARLTYKIPGGPEAKNYDPAWSPDSTRIAYCSTEFHNGRPYSMIRMCGARGESDFMLAVADCYSTPVSWSPDGKGIAYLSGCRNDRPPAEVWSLNLTKPFPVTVLSGSGFYNLDWSYTR